MDNLTFHSPSITVIKHIEGQNVGPTWTELS